MQSSVPQNDPMNGELFAPFDIWLEIIAYLIDAKDSSSLSLCCRYFHSLVAAQRCKQISLESGESNRIEAFQALFSSRAILCENIRHIDLTGCHSDPYAMLVPLLRELAANLQPHTLRSIRFALTTCVHVTY